MTIISPQKDRLQSYRNQANKIRKRESEARKLEDWDEAERLRKLAEKAETNADGIEKQIRQANQ